MECPKCFNKMVRVDLIRETWKSKYRRDVALVCTNRNCELIISDSKSFIGQGYDNVIERKVI